MIENSSKINLFLSAWNKYIPVIRILMKRSAEKTQVLNMNSTDFERDAKRKSGYKFDMNFINGRPDILIAGSEIIQSFIYAIQNDKRISELLLKSDYSFILNSKYQLEIKHNITEKALTIELDEEILL